MQTQKTVSTVSVNIMNKKLQEMTIFRRHMNQLFDIDYWIKTSLTYFIKVQWFHLISQ